MMIGFIVATLVPLGAATLLAVPWFRASIETEAQRALGTHQTVARELFAEKVVDRRDQVTALGRVFVGVESLSTEELQSELDKQASALKLSYLLFVDESGSVLGSTTGAVKHTITWPILKTMVGSQRSSGAVGIVPITELAALGRAKASEIALKETEGGSAPASEAVGALSIIGVAPVVNEQGKRVGALIGVETLKKDNAFVDSVVSKVGGVATVFQNGVRVATTVEDERGQRAIGTVVSDKVRAAVLDTGESFEGDALVVGRSYLASYEPIKDPTGEVVGMVFVGLDRAPYQIAARDFTLAMIGVTVLSVILGVGFALFGSLQMSTPFVAIGAAAERIAGGDLTVSVPDSGFREAQAMGEAFNAMASGLRSVLGNVRSSVTGLEAVASEIAAASTEKADHAASQASAVAQASATVEELDRSFVAVSDGARRVLEIAEDSLEAADSGRDTVLTAAGHIERLADGASSTLEAAGSLADVADDIDQVTFVIGSIAEQTKILALNAAIEAARAGEAGKGFSVVATEIRSLADSVSTSVGRIETLVRSIQEASKALAATARQQAELGETTAGESRHTRDKFDEIFERMTRTASAAREIATAASQQQSAARQIVQVMQQVSEGVAGSATSAQQLAGAAGDIKRETSSLSNGLQGFKVD
jgi:methyl-accepting chemotaxis protein